MRNNSQIYEIYRILNISQAIISKHEITIAHFLEQFYQGLSNAKSSLYDKLEHINTVIRMIEKFHCYFHFEQSWIYTLYAYILHKAGKFDDEIRYVEMALFQDKMNDVVKNDNREISSLFKYNKNYLYETAFLKFALGSFKRVKQVKQLDLSIKLIISDRIDDAKILLDDITYDSHRLYTSLAICDIYRADTAASIKNIEKAAKSIETAHQRYHKYAAYIYELRASIFVELQQLDLARNDSVKANNLYPKDQII